MRTSVVRSALSFAVSTAVIVILGLISGWETAGWLSLVVGLWVGLLLAWGAFWLFGWGGWAARPIHLWGVVGGVLVLVVLFVIGTMVVGVIPSTAAVTIIFWTACGLILGAASIAAEIGRRRQDEDRNRM